jgi:cysteine-rich repeat protein
MGGEGGETGSEAGASGAGGSPEPAVCGNNAVETGEDCDGGNTDDLDGCNSKCQSETSAGPGLATTITDDGYNGTLGSMTCVNLVVATRGDGLVDSVKVKVGLTHTFIGDLVLKLVSPNNTVVTLMSRPRVAEPADDGAGSGANNSNLISTSPISFVTGGATSAENMGNATNTLTACQDDALCVYAPAAGAAAAGTLVTFNGQTAAGTWKFCAGDALTGDVGTLDAVRLSVVQ